MKKLEIIYDGPLTDAERAYLAQHPDWTEDDIKATRESPDPKDRKGCISTAPWLNWIE